MIEDVTKLLDKEQGTAFDHESVLFANFGDGDIFSYDRPRVDQMNKMLEQDGKANTLEQVLTLPIRQAPVYVRQDEAKNKVQDFVERAMLAPANNGGMSTPLNLVIAQMCGAIVHKKTFFEKVWTERDGQATYDKLAWRPTSTCAIVRDPETGAFQGFKQERITEKQSQKNKDLFFKPISAFVYVHGKHRNPMEGVSSLDVAYWCWQTKQKIRYLWYSFLEGQSLPKTLVHSPNQQASDKAARKIVGLRQGGVVGLSDDITVTAFESSGRGAGQFVEALRWLDSEASGSVLAGFTDLGSQAAGGTGSFALSKDQTDFFLMSRQSVSREMQDDLNNFVVADLVRWNFGPDEKAPRLEFGPIAEDDANMAINLLQATTQSWNEQTSPLPREFMEELVERVAGFLELNTQVVREGLDRAAEQARSAAEQASPNPEAPRVAEVAGAVNAATSAVKQKIQQVQTPEPHRVVQQPVGGAAAAALNVR